MIRVTIKKNIKTYKGNTLLQVDTTFPAGSVTKVYGPSGAGKTTFLQVIAGLTQPEEGIIECSGRIWLDTAKHICLTAQQRMTGFVFQDYALFPNMTVSEHLQYASSDKQLIERLLKMGQMDSFKQHKPKQLSGGQQQRLAILRALATKPKLLLMDEAFSALDDELRETLIVALKTLLKEFGTTTIIVSHHASETAGFADRELMITL
jgi:molybdate transport system ATP-binding protein